MNIPAQKNRPIARGFGIGCFHFNYKKPVPFQFKTSEYVSALSDVLKSLTSLSELSIYYDKSLEQIFEVFEDMPSLDDGYLFPHIEFLRVTFRLYIPQRIQAELVNRERTNRTQTEQFKVTIWQEYHGPITFVECIDPEDEYDPSFAIYIVKKYLERELAKTSGPIFFECLGPSPFHADFFVSKARTADGELSVTEIAQRGYDRFEISYNATDTDENDNLLTDVYLHLTRELDVYYEIVRENLMQQKTWWSLEKKWRELLSKVKKSPSFFNLKRKFQIYLEAKNLITEAYAFSASSQIARQKNEHLIKEMYEKGLPHFLKNKITARGEKLSTYPTAAILDWARHIHGSSFKIAELATVFISALLGGLIGVLATVWLKI